MKRGSIFLVCTAVWMVYAGGCLLHYARGTYSYTAINGVPHVTGMDDAFIGFRYGWNLSHYHTLSWNESGFRRTEGFTDPMWVYLSAAWSMAGDKDLVYPGMVLFSILMTAGSLFALTVRVEEDTGSISGLLGLALLGLSPVMWLQSTSGLEGSVFGVLVGLFAYTAITKRSDTLFRGWFWNVLSFLIVTIRSDGFVYLLVLLAGLILTGRRAMLRSFMGGGIGIVVLMTWRLINFGQIYPNTQVAKLNFGLLERLGSGLVLYIQSMLNGGVVFMLIGLFGALFMPKSTRLAFWVTVGGWSAYYLYIGGDLILERHLITIWVLCAGMSGYFFARLMKDRRSLALVAMLLAGLFIPFYTHDPRFNYLQPKPQDAFILIGKEMASHRAQYGTVVVYAAGKLPFYAGGDFIDTLGLNDSELARIQRPRFIPGHSAGNDQMAIQLARASSALYSYLAPNLDLELDRINTGDILLWAVNDSTSPVVHHGLSRSDFDLMEQGGPFDYTLLVRGGSDTDRNHVVSP